MFYIILVLLGACSFGVLSTFVKISYGLGFNVGEVVGSQSLFGAIFLWLLVWLRSRRHTIHLKQALLLMLVGTTTGITGIFYYSALQFIEASLAIILLFQFTWLGVLLEAFLLRQRPARGKLYALVVIAVGTILASGLSGAATGEISWLGIFFGLLSAVSYTLFIWFSGKVVLTLPALTRSALMLTGSAVITLIIFPPFFLFNGALGEGLWLWGGLLALFGAVIPPLLFSIGVPHIGSGLATILGAVELPVAVGMAFFVLSEQVTPWQWAGIVAILIGVALPEMMSRWRGDKFSNELSRLN